MEDYTPDFLATWLLIGRRCALHVGLEPADADDCVAEFVHKMRAEAVPPSTNRASAASEAYLYRCALNHALDARRCIKRRRLHEVNPGSPGSSENAADAAPTPEAALLHEEF